MPNPTVRIILDAIDQASPEFEKVGKSGVGLKDKLLGVAKAVGVVAAAIGVGAFFKKAVDEARAAEEGASALTHALSKVGVQYKDVEKDVDAATAAIQRNTRFSDDDAIKALTNLVIATDDYKGSLAKLPVVADLAEKKQMSMADASLIVAKAMSGGAKGLKDMGVSVKDAAEIMEMLDGKIGGLAETQGKTLSGSLDRAKNAWDEIAEALGTAMLGNEKVGSSIEKVIDFLVKLADWIEKNDATIRALVDTVLFLGTAVAHVFDSVAGLITGIINSIQGTTSLIFNTIKEDAGEFLEFMGGILEKASSALAKVGIKVGTGLADSLKETGRQMQASAQGQLDVARRVMQQADKDVLRFMDLSKFRRAEDVADAKDKGDERTANNAAQLKQQQKDFENAKATEARLLAEAHAATKAGTQKLHAEIQRVIGEMIPPVVATAEQSIAQLRAAGEKALDPSRVLDWQAALKKAQDQGVVPLTIGTQAVAENVDSVEDSTDGIADNVTTMQRMADVADAALGAAQSFGVIDAAAENALTNVIQIAQNLPKVLTGDPTAILSVAGSLGSVLTTVFGDSAADKARKEALRKNTDALEELARTNKGLLELETGAGKAADIREAFLIQQKMGGNAFREELVKRGLSMTDVEAVAKDLGIDLAGGSKAFDQLMEALDRILGSQGSVFGTGFEGEMERIRQVAKATGAENLPADEIKNALIKFGGSGVADLFQGDVLGNLQGVFSKSPSQFAALAGGLSSSAFIEAIQLLIELERSGGGLAGISVPTFADPREDGVLNITELLPRTRTGIPIGGEALAIAGGAGVGVQFNGGITFNVTGDLDPDKAFELGNKLAGGWIERVDEELGQRGRLEDLFRGRATLS